MHNAPLWLNIRKAEIGNKKLQGIKLMKVVTHCKGGKTTSNYILKEYMAYRTHNMLSPYSFRVRLVRMKYIETGRKNKTSEN